MLWKNRWHHDWKSILEDVSRNSIMTRCESTLAVRRIIGAPRQRGRWKVSFGPPLGKPKVLSEVSRHIVWKSRSIGTRIDQTRLDKARIRLHQNRREKNGLDWISLAQTGIDQISREKNSLDWTRLDQTRPDQATRTRLARPAQTRCLKAED